MQQIYRRTTMPKCDFNKAPLYQWISGKYCSPLLHYHLFFRKEYILFSNDYFFSE